MMFYKFLNYLNSIRSFPYYFVTPLPYGIGTCAEHILLSISNKDKKKIILLYPNIFKNFFKYKICNKYFFDNIVIDEVSQKKYKYLKNMITIFINIEFIFRRLFLYIFKKFNLELGEQFRFPLIGVLPIFVNNNYTEKKLNTNINLNIRLNNPENEKFFDFLSSLGISKNHKYVCLHVRDNLYYSDSDRRPFRNSNINNYVDLIDHLIKNDYFVIRLGYKNNKFNYNNKNFFDYSGYSEKKDFIGLALVKHCYFYVGTQSGPLDLATLFEKPIFLTNAVRLFDSFPKKKNSSAIFKTIKWKKNNEKISFKNYLKMPLEYHHQRFIDNSLDYFENTPEEICQSLIEFMKNLKNNDFQISNIQEKFNALIKSKYKKNDFMKNNKNYMDVWLYNKTVCNLENAKGSYCPLFLEKNFND